MEWSWEARLTPGTSSCTVMRTVRLLTRCAAANHGAELGDTFSAMAVTPCMRTAHSLADLLQQLT